MKKVISIHNVNPRPGVSQDVLDQLMMDAEQIFRDTEQEDYKTYIVKADRGANKGQYAMVNTFDSVAARNRYFTEDGEPSADFQRVSDLVGSEILERWFAAVEMESPVYTDFIRLSD